MNRIENMKKMLDSLESPLVLIKIKTKQSREKLYKLLGDLPKRHHPISTHLVSTEERTHYILEKLAIDMNGLETVPAYLTRPKSATGPIPFILYNHAKIKIGEIKTIIE